MLWILLLFLWQTVSLSWPTLAHTECGTPEPVDLLSFLFRNNQEESELFGDSIKSMGVDDLAAIVQRLLVNADSEDDPIFQLSGMPIVYHVLPNQDNGAVGAPSLTMKQAEWTTNITNQLFTIYDRSTKNKVPFASFVTDSVVIHENIVQTVDCGSLSSNDMESIIQKAVEWEFKFHIVVCESNTFSGRASFPQSYSVSHPLHNAIRLDYRSVACTDDDGTFLCDLINGTKVSHTRWWRSRSAVVSHEIGHLFGLYHTFRGKCWGWLVGGDDQIPDTPATTVASSESCPGLLPYDRDRDWSSDSAQPNMIAEGNNTNSVCVGDGACGTQCAACCTPEKGNSQCTKYSSEFEVVTEDENHYPHCCDDPSPINTCGLFAPGIDPLNNVMSYIPDFCAYEFTPGQMARMMSQIYSYKTYIYCNYASMTNPNKCQGIPCSSNATSPRCTA